jgi:phosphoribosylanthranilate isomerase
MVRAKICGLRDVATVKATVGYGADAIGFVVKSPKSPRNIDLDLASELISTVPPFIYTVAVTASTSVDEIIEDTSRLRPDALQLHSKIAFENISTISRSVKGWGTRLIGALAIDVRASYSENMIRDLTSKAKKLTGIVDAVIIDSAVDGSMGGTGVKGDFKLMRCLRDAVAPFPIILAGGLTPANVEDAILTVKPYVVDVSSGVESSPGVKDLSKVKLFIEKVRRLG